MSKLCWPNFVDVDGTDLKPGPQEVQPETVSPLFRWCKNKDSVVLLNKTPCIVKITGKLQKNLPEISWFAADLTFRLICSILVVQLVSHCMSENQFMTN